MATIIVKRIITASAGAVALAMIDRMTDEGLKYLRTYIKVYRDFK